MKDSCTHCQCLYSKSGYHAPREGQSQYTDVGMSGSPDDYFKHWFLWLSSSSFLTDTGRQHLRAERRQYEPQSQGHIGTHWTWHERVQRKKWNVGQRTITASIIEGCQLSHTCERSVLQSPKPMMCMYCGVLRAEAKAG